MCTWLTKVRGDTVLKLDGIHCCMSVEDVQAVAPDISRANGWQEVYVDQPFPGKMVVWVPLADEAICRLNSITPAGVLEYRGRTVRFISCERIAVAREYVAAKSRRASAFPRHQGFLENLPAEVLKASARGRVVALLDRLLAQAGSVEPAEPAGTPDSPNAAGR